MEINVADHVGLLFMPSSKTSFITVIPIIG